MLKISFTSDPLPTQGALVLTVAEKGSLGAQGAALDKKLGGALTRAMDNGGFTGAKEKTLTILSPSPALTRIVLIGMGEPEKADAALWARIGGTGMAALSGKDVTAYLLIDTHKGLDEDTAEAAAQAALGARLRSYRFDLYRTKQKPEDKPALKNLIVASSAGKTAASRYAPLDKVADGVELARDLVSEPANVLTPAALAQQAKTLEKLGVKVTLLDAKQMKKFGMGALLGVAQGSPNPPYLVVMEWQGKGKKAPLCFVGKGVTFDTGGISLKPPAGMWDMKYDMAGSAAVIGAMKAIAGRKAKESVVGIVGLVENMPSGTAQRPGDVVTSADGQTIEVQNTDAEGRLVLADALWYAQKFFKPRAIVDLATLTGAIKVALGSDYAGLFSNDDTLADRLSQAGKAVEEKLWRLPLGESYDRLLKSDIADMKNIGGPDAGSITAAQFLQRFIGKGVAWAHLDIAGTAWQTKDSAVIPQGATAFGVRLLDQFVAEAEGRSGD